MKIAIIGSEGFVGKACVHIFEKKAEVIKIDPRLENSVSDIKGDIDVALICVPTPMGDMGRINSSIVEKVIDELKAFKNALIVLKSTVLPDIVERLSKDNPRFIYNPEFLTERNANNDAEYPIMTVLGGEPEATAKMEMIYKKYSICEPAPYYHMSPAEASAVKYGMNSFLATKVAFWNEYYNMCQKNGLNYDIIKQAIGTDTRISPSHMNVPGHDGKFYFSGSCFPKDVSALLHFAKEDLSILKSAWNKTCEYRKNVELTDREKVMKVEFKSIY